MRTRLGTLGLAVVVLGALLTGCQGRTDSADAPPPATGTPDRPVSDRPDKPDDDTDSDADDDLPPGNRGVVTGRVRTPSGAPVVDATVRVRSLDTPPVPVPELVVTSDDDGYFRWQLAPGRYEVSVVPANGTSPVAAPAVEVRASARHTVDITVR
ncbi:carboxypeptidase-like regulatory domain-containing protein [Micromonospora sp. NPDC050187]|uniref:carboxypeptidase-like regulatory domain-containing protein n=1 Tax=Micromonospora sp. NPDC050187 TaxID=3364277 RepID=UPI0037B14ACB